MLPPSTTLRAAYRLADLLRRNSVAQALSLVTAAQSYADVPATEYRRALGWLERSGFVIWHQGSAEVDRNLLAASDDAIASLLMLRALEVDDAAWLYDPAMLDDADDIPIDALNAADGLGISPSSLLSIARGVGGKIDLEMRARVGALGESELVDLLTPLWPNGVTHVSLVSDGFGYDVALTTDAGTWHLEVKSTTRRGRLVAYLSRHEFSVAMADSSWQLVVVALDEEGLVAVATVDKTHLPALVPTDPHEYGRWETAKLEFLPSAITPGLPFLGENGAGRFAAMVSRSEDRSSTFAWLPVVRR